MGRPVRFDLRPGDDGTIFTRDDPISTFDTTDADGEVDATFLSPNIQAVAGETSVVRMFIGAGAEIADPQPRVSFAGVTSFAYAASGDLSQPAASQTFLEDPGGGFQVGH